MIERNLKYLLDNKILWRCNPTDRPSKVFDWGWYYENGTRTCYELFRNKVRINTYKSLFWHLRVLWYLNPEMSQESFESLARYIADNQNGFIIFNISEITLAKIIYDVSMSDLDRAPNNKLRKVIFYDYCGLTKSEKCSIAASLTKTSVTPEDIYETMLYMFDMNVKITNTSLAKHLNCSTKTVQRKVDDTLKREIRQLNSMLK